MEMVSLDGQLATHWPHEISGGQQQRVASPGRWRSGHR
jgi:iron(III) transport system ATP-binding protein